MPCTGRGFLLSSRCLREGGGRHPCFAEAETETQGGTALPKVTCLEAAEPGPQPPTHNKVAGSCLGPSPRVSTVSGLVTTCPCHSGRVSGLALTAPRASGKPTPDPPYCRGRGRLGQRRAFGGCGEPILALPAVCPEAHASAP